MTNILAVLGKIEILEKLNKGKGRKLCRRRSPQFGNPVVEFRHHSRCRHRYTLRGRENGRCLSSVLYKIALGEEIAKQAVVVVMMSLFDVSDTLLTVVVGVNCLMMHMQRRQYHHWQISGQQYDRRNMSQQTVHLSGCKGTTFPQFTNLFFHQEPSFSNTIFPCR